MQFTIQFTEAEDGGVLAATLRRIAAAFDPSTQGVLAHPEVPAGLKPWLPETASNAPVASVTDTTPDEAASAHVETVTKTRRSRKAAEPAVTPETVAEVVTADDARVLSVAADTGESVDDIEAAYNAAAAAAGAPTVAEIEQTTAPDPEQERRTLLESIAPLLEKAGFPWYRANVPGGKRLAEISIDEARDLHAKVTAHLGSV